MSKRAKTRICYTCIIIDFDLRNNVNKREKKNMLPGVSSEGSEADDVSGPWGGKGAV